MSNIAILASGSGSNALKIMEHFNESKIADVKLVISNKVGARVLDHAHRLSVDSVVIENKKWSEEPEMILETLNHYKIDFIVLAGFLRKIPEELIEAFPNAIVNIHPALLPKYGGKGMYGNHVHKAVYESGEKESGITIHWVNENYDEGQIIFQASTNLDDSDNPQSIQKKVQVLEHKYYPQIIERIISEQQ